MRRGMHGSGAGVPRHYKRYAISAGASKDSLLITSSGNIGLGTWTTVQHMGPTAQAFYTVYGLGSDEKRLSALETRGTVGSLFIQAGPLVLGLFGLHLGGFVAGRRKSNG
jgi:hypothetical protein